MLPGMLRSNIPALRKLDTFSKKQPHMKHLLVEMKNKLIQIHSSPHRTSGSSLRPDHFENFTQDCSLMIPLDRRGVEKTELCAGSF